MKPRSRRGARKDDSGQKGRVHVYCWDASAFLAWINGETKTPQVDADLEAAVEDIDNGRAILVVSVMASCEVLNAKMDTQEKRDRYAQLFERDNIVWAEVSQEIAKRAGEIRLEADEKHGYKLGSEDSIYMATGFAYNADEIHAFDPHFTDLNGQLQSLPIPMVFPRGCGARRLPLTIPSVRADTEAKDGSTEGE